jgi:hypothetical protein
LKLETEAVEAVSPLNLETFISVLRPSPFVCGIVASRSFGAFKGGSHHPDEEPFIVG